MGTWGTGPFDSDTAEDFLNELEDRPAWQRLTVIENTFRSAIEARGSSSSSVLPEEVTAAAAAVVANIPAGSYLARNEEYPNIAKWLTKPITPALASSAIRALEVTLPADG